jgi:hypothetical protein
MFISGENIGSFSKTNHKLNLFNPNSLLVLFERVIFTLFFHSLNVLDNSGIICKGASKDNFSV